MRSILILTAIMTQLLLTDVVYAEGYEDCKTNCAADKGSRDMDCPSPYDSSSANQEREQCLKNNQDAYSSCIKSCPPSAPPPPESVSSPMSY